MEASFPEDALKPSALLIALALSLPAAAQAPVPPRTSRDLDRILDAAPADPGRAARLRARLDQQIPPGLTGSALARACWDRARAAEEAGAVQRQIADLRRALEAGAGGDRDRIASELATAEWRGGSPRNALADLEALRHNGRAGFEASHAAMLSRVMTALGDLAGAKEMLSAARTSLNDVQWSRNAALLLPNLRANLGFAEGELLDAQGLLPQAEAAYRAALTENVRAVELRRTNDTVMLGMPSTVTLEDRQDYLQQALSLNLMRQGRLLEAELSLRDLLAKVLARHGKTSIYTGAVVTALSRTLYEGGRAAEAEGLARKAVAILEEAGVVPEAMSLARARWTRAAALVSLGRDPEACAEYERAHAGLTGPGLAPALLRDEALWALALVRSGRSEAALTLLEPMIRTRQAQTGDGRDQTAEWRGFQAMALARLGRRAEAIRAFRDVARAFLERRDGAGDADAGAPGRVQRRAWILEAYLEQLCLCHEAGQDGEAGFDVPEEALRCADLARSGRVQSAVAASAVRAGARDPRMADQVRRDQDLKFQVAARYRLLGDALSAPADQQSPAAIRDLRRSLEQLSAERKALDENLQRHFPGFHDLVAPAVPSLEAARAALAPGEALVSILATGERSYLWAFRKTGPVAFASSPLGERELAPLVARIRQSLDPGETPLRDWPAFDLAAAHRLYEGLLAPLEPVWRDANTLVACVNGALGQLPLSVLPTRAWVAGPVGPVPFAGYREVPWLARTHAVFQVPSVSAFVRLRSLAQGPAERRPFLGFGDPQFGAAPAPRAALTARGAGLRNLAIVPAGPAGQAPAAAPEAWPDYGRLPPLPETRDEILAVASALGADPARDVFLGREASKVNLFKLPLAQWRILAFATHGLVPGDFPGLAAPALALAAPERPQDSGLLTLDEILDLKLDADWVVLSACNTAAGDGLGAEAVSGLGRAFFYAGSRALLVTHWPVESVSAQALVTSVFRHWRGPGQMSRAEALRLGMLEVMAGQSSDPGTGVARYAYAHPLFWAPYALVGDGR